MSACLEINIVLNNFSNLIGERLTEEEVDQLLQGMEDKDGNVNYEG